MVKTTRGIVYKIRYRVPVEHNSRATKQVKETLLHCANRRQAEGVLAMRKAQIFDGTYRPRAVERPQNFEEYSSGDFLPAKKGKPVWAEYERYLRLHLVPYFGAMLLREIELRHANAYRAARLAAGASRKSVKNEIDCASAIYAMAIADGKAERDPFGGVDHGKIENRRERLLSEDELGRLLAQLSRTNGWLRPFFVVLYYTGLRISDVCSITWDRVSFARNFLSQKQKKTGDWVYPPMHPTLADELRRWKEESRHAGSRWVFPQRFDPAKHISRHAVKEPWRNLLLAAGVHDLTRHDMRKLLITTLKARGASTEQVRAISGHATEAMVAHYNLGPDAAMLEAARGAIALLPGLGLAPVSGGNHPGNTESNVSDANSSNHGPNGTD